MLERTRKHDLEGNGLPNGLNGLHPLPSNHETDNQQFYFEIMFDSASRISLAF